MDVISHEDPEIAYLVIDGEMIVTTPGHPFYTSDGEWIEVQDLQLGDLIMNLDLEYGTVNSIQIVPQVQVMYDLDVETVDTFAVGDGAWVVHNQNSGIIKCWRYANPDNEDALLPTISVTTQREIARQPHTDMLRRLVTAQGGSVTFDQRVKLYYDWLGTQNNDLYIELSEMDIVKIAMDHSAGRESRVLVHS